MVDKLVNKIVDLLISEQFITTDSQEEYVYSLTCVLESVITNGTIFLISLITSNTIQTACFLLFFYTLRKRTGGYHAKTFYGCYFTTIGIWLAVTGICKSITHFTYLQWILLTVFGSIILVIGTVNHPNMNMSPEEVSAAKLSARMVLILELCIICFLKWLKADAILLSYLSVAIILCGILQGIAKLLGQEV